MDAADKRMLEREALRNMIQQWNANRLDLFALSEPNENLEFHGVMRFYFQDLGQKIATKCIRVASDATVSDVIETLIEKFRPDMRMLSLGSYSLWETHGPDDERKLEPHEKPLLVQLNWHADDREGRFLLKCLSNNEVPLSSASDKGDQNFKRKLSKREKKELKKKEKLSRLKSDTNDENRPVAEKLYTELPETSFMRSISNPEAVMRRRRQQKLGRKLQQFKSKDGGPDTGGTLRIYGGILRPDVSYITLLLSVNDSAATVLRETLDKYGMAHQDPQQYCIVQEDNSDNSEYILEDDECPLALMNMTRSSIMFHVRRRPADAQPRRRKKKASTGGGTGVRPGTEPVLVEVAPDTSPLENGRRVRVTEAVEVGSGNGTTLQLYGPSIQPRHCVVAPAEGGGYTVTPLHADAHVYLNGQRVVHTQRLQHGCILKFGRVSTFRFADPTQENIINRNLAQSQHYGSGSIYDRSPTSPGDNGGAMSPTSLASHQPDALDSNANTTDNDYMRTMSPVSNDTYYRDSNDPAPFNNNNTLKLDNESLMMSQHLSDSKDDYGKDEHSGSVYNVHEQSSSANRTTNSQYKDNYETTFDLEGNVETKSICSAKSGGSGHENRSGGGGSRGQEAILPAVLEFPDAGQAQFLSAVITRLDPHAPAFKLAPVYTLYLCARYRASTHYRQELTPTERAHKLTAFLHHVATLIHATVQERAADSAAQAFWMANASELLHFLKYDRHISSFSTQAQELLPVTVQTAFSNLVTCFQEELSRALGTLTSSTGVAGDATEATAPTLQALATAMVLLRRCRVNAALTIQLFSHLFHYINAVCFNKLVTEPSTVSRAWGAALSSRLALLAAWAERQGLELAADCHLARTHQAARLIQGTYNSAEEAVGALGACFKLNSVQVRALLAPLVPPDVLEAAVQHARDRADELCRADGREVRLEESEWLGAGLLVPADGFSAEVVRGVPPGLAEFVAPLQRGGLCRLAHQPHAPGAWTVYMAHPHPQRAPHPRTQPPRVHIVHLHKNANGMGLSIVAAKGAGQSKLGIYIKSVVPGGAAAADGRLAAGDQLLSVDGQSLVGITQEKAAEYLVRTGPTVTLEVAKQGAMLHGLATLLHQPAYNQKQAAEDVQYEDPARRNSGTFTNTHPALLRATSPLSELATAGYGRRPCHYRCQLLRDESTESSTTDDSEEFHPTYHGSIPRLIITLDRENEQLYEDLSPDTPGCPLELKDPPPQRPIPVFTFTCEDFDEQNQNNECVIPATQVDEQIPPPVPDLPSYELSSESGEPAALPPQMRPIDTNLTLELFNARGPDTESYQRRCTALDDCVSACECCRTPQPEAQPIPFIDEPDSEPFIFENDAAPNKVATPKMRRILPSLSVDRPDDAKPTTADAVCQTSSPPVRVNVKAPPSTLIVRKINDNFDVKSQSHKFENIHCRLKRALFSISKSYSSKSDDTEIPSTYSTSESFNETTNRDNVNKTVIPNTVEPGAKKILDSIDRKSWKSPDEFRPSFGKVKALTKHFNDINLTYSVKIYKRNCQSSPNLSMRNDRTIKMVDPMPTSTSLANIHYEVEKTDTTESKRAKMSDDEVKSILIQLEDWSRYGSRGSEDTLAQGNEFEIPNLPTEEAANGTSNEYIFNEIVDKKPRKITLDNIKLKSNQSSVNSDQANRSKESLVVNVSINSVGSMENRQSSLSIDECVKREATDMRSWADTVVQSCPDVWRGSARGRAACTGAPARHSCPALASHCARVTLTSPSGGGVSGGAMRRASERDLPSRLAAEPVKPSKSTPALHHAAAAAVAAAAASTSASPHRHHAPDTPLLHEKIVGASPAVASGAGTAWVGRSRSSHNLSAGSQHDGFYQNLSTLHSSNHHTLQDRWSSLRSSTGSNRPQSAHFSAATQPDQPPDSPLHQSQQANAASARAAKLAELSEEVSRRQYMQQRAPALLPHHHPMHNHHHMHGQQQAAQVAMPMSPQMSAQVPNQMQSQMPNQLQSQMPNQMQTQQPNQMPMQMPNQMPMQMPNQMSIQTSSQMSSQMPNQMSQMSNQISTTPSQMSSQITSQMSTQVSMAGGPQNAYSPHQMYHNQHSQPQRYEWHPPGPPSPMRMQPPIAPKPSNSRRSEMEIEEHLHQQPQPQTVSTVQPDDERYVASALEPPAVSVYPAGGGGAASRSQPAHNPWQREERERQAEARRAAARARRDAGIAQLLSLGASRTPVQNQQLRALQLERDFELRATQHDQEEGAAAEGGAEEERSSPEPSDESERMQVQHVVHSHMHTSTHTSTVAAAPVAAPAGNVPPTHVPKSILKVNTRSDITNGYATDTVMQEDIIMVSEACAGVSALNVNVPAPPARGSSFAVMAERTRALSPPQAPHVQHGPHTQHASHAQHAPHSQHSSQQLAHHVQQPPAEPAQPPLSPVSSGRDKRVSFHERAQATPPAAPPPAPPTSSPPPLHDPPAREDPDRFIEEAESMLASPVSPTTPTTPAGLVAHTPGVIGAQEVYRDPRARRLAEREARASAAPIPEQLSFKEKMKMFALESGDASTPKDKVKISRAQRDIDAVH